jgi:RHS repeat-associated protein
MMRTRCAIITLGVVLSSLRWSIGADAQTFEPPPIRPSIDENGVELRSGRLESRRTDIVIGQPGAGGLSFGRIPRGSNYRLDTAWYAGAISIAPPGPSTTTYTVSLAGYAESFDKANSPSSSPFVSVQGLGSTLTEDTSNYYYTSPDGTFATFSKSIPTGGLGAASIVQLSLPDGEIRTYTYVQGTVTGNPSRTIWRMQSVRNNRGYQISLTYFDSRLTIPSADEWNWYKISGAKGINLSVDYCSPSANSCTGLTQSWPTATYGPIFPYPTFFVTDALGNTTTYTYGNETFSIRWPGSQSDDVVYTFAGSIGPEADIVASVNRRGRIWTYSRSSTATDQTVVVTDPQLRQSTYVFDVATGSIKSFTNTASEVTTYQNDTKGRPSIVTLPTGETIRYQYDARGNVTEVRRTSFPAGSPDLVSTAGYDSTCSGSTAKKCNKPNWTRDAAGNQTDYVYSTAHGNPTSITLPAPVVGGTRPATSYAFTALQAYYKNSTGSIVAAGTSVYYLTSVAECRTTSGCSATSADQLRTDIGYGANNVANNRLPVQTTIRDGSGTLIATTNLQYDGVGNLVSVNGPLTGTVDQSVTRYDALRRVIGTVGPDPDGAGARLHIGVRTTYDSRGLPALVETGNLPGQADSSWANFVPAISVVREFDAERRMTKESAVAAGTTHAVQQVSFDILGRVDCRATRMNPVYFGALPSACIATADGPFGPDRIDRYGYDNADRVISVTSGYGHPTAIAVQTMTYFTGGRLHTLSDGKGNKTTYNYDGYGRLYRTYFPHLTNVGASSSTDYEEYVYNANSQVTATRRRSGVVIGTPRDALGRVTLKDVPATAEDVYFGYDNQGRVLSARYGSTSGSGIVQTYDGLGRLSTRTVFGRQLSYLYDLLGRRTRLTHPDGFYVNYGYSNVDEVTTVTDSTGANLATYAYDGLGARSSITRPNNALTSYVPDAVKRLQELRQDLSGTSFDLTETFTYNPAGQITSKTVSNDAAYTAIPSPLTSTTTALFDGQNQLTQFAGSTVTDDANGNVWTGLGSLSYTYDALGQLRQASGGASPVLVDYDPAGMLRRVQVGSTTTEYLYDGGDLIAQYNGAAVLRRFVHGPSADEPLVVYEGSGTTNKSWLHADERGSIIAKTNASGVSSASVKYRPDGDSGALASAFGYTGQLYLPELQLYYYKARMYSPKIGRFLQPDPIGYAGGTNLYSYVGNDSVNRTDPSGLCWQLVPNLVRSRVTAENEDGNESSGWEWNIRDVWECIWSLGWTAYEVSQSDALGAAVDALFDNPPQPTAPQCENPDGSIANDPHGTFMDPNVGFVSVYGEGYFMPGLGLALGMYRDFDSGNWGFFVSFEYGGGWGGSLGASFGAVSQLSAFKGDAHVVGGGAALMSGNYISKYGNPFAPRGLSFGPSGNAMPLPPLGAVPASVHSSASWTVLSGVPRCP